MTDTAIADHGQRGRNVKALRNLRGLRQVDLAQAVGVSRATIARIEAGEATLPVILATVARVLGVEPQRLDGALIPSAEPT